MISLVLTLVLVGVALWLIEQYVPMSEPIKRLIYVVVIIALILYLFRAFGVGDIAVPRG
jgi:hypothetical protein